MPCVFLRLDSQAPHSPSGQCPQNRAEGRPGLAGPLGSRRALCREDPSCRPGVQSDALGSHRLQKALPRNTGRTKCAPRKRQRRPSTSARDHPHRRFLAQTLEMSGEMSPVPRQEKTGGPVPFPLQLLFTERLKCHSSRCCGPMTRHRHSWPQPGAQTLGCSTLTPGCDPATASRSHRLASRPTAQEAGVLFSRITVHAGSEPPVSCASPAGSVLETEPL